MSVGTVVKAGRAARIQPFDMAGVERHRDGILRYANRPASLVAMLRRSVESVPGEEAIVELGGERITYQQLWDRATRVAGGLRDQGIRRGDRVAVELGNGLDWCVAFFAILMAGGVVVPVNTRFAPPEIEYVLGDSGAAYSFRPGIPLPDGDPLAVDASPSDLAAIFYTSGTTGFPKGAMLTHACFLSNTETCRRVAELPDEGGLRNLVSVPLFHVTGCNSQLLPTLELRGTTVIMPAFEVQAFIRAAQDEHIDILTSVPAVFWLATTQPNFKDHDWRGVRWVTYGGAPCPPELIRRMREGFPNAMLGNGFGLTETSSVATFLPDRYCEVRPETVGFGAPVVELDLAAEDPGSRVGELLVRAPNVVAGYWNKPEATAETFVGGWLHTGDLARLDEDGFCQIVDRIKDMINRGGENVYSVEVENALMEHPAVFEVAVLAVPDAMMGEKVGAVVVPTPGAQLDPGELAGFARERLADFKVPQFVSVRTAPLPRNPGGKVLKPALRQETDWGRPVW